MTVAALSSCVGLLAGTTWAGEVQSPMRIAEPTKQHTTATVETEFGIEHYYVSSNVVVRTLDIESLRGLITQVPGVTIDQAMGKNGDFFAIRTPNVASAVRVRNLLSGVDGVLSVQLDQKRYNPFYEEQMKKFFSNAANVSANASSKRAIGIEPVQDFQSPRGTSDPLLASQWHLTNGSGTFAGNDNNITSMIYDVLGYTGSGVNVALSAGRLNRHIDVDHTDIINNYNPTFSMVFDPNDLGDNIDLTGNAGIVSATRGNGIAGQGVAPESNVSTIYWGGSTTSLHEFEAYDWMLNDVAIKVFGATNEYARNNSAYNGTGALTYITDALQNSIRKGRQSKGVINIFGTGSNILLSLTDLTRSPLPNPYEFANRIDGTFSPIDQIQVAGGNTVVDGVNAGYVEGPYFFNGQTNNYPPAADFRSFVINTVSEDGQYDSISSLGTNIFASVYGGTSNLFYADDNSDDAGRGVATIVPGGGNVGLLPADASQPASLSAVQTGPSIAAGIIALMLDANPKLTARDIHHILFNSIQESTRPAAVKWPNYTNVRSYYVPDDNFTAMSFWQKNTGFYNSDTITNQSIRHSDQYGFGVIDAELAIQMASTYGKAPKLTLLDSGEITEDDGRLPRDVPIATFDVFVPADGATGASGSAGLVVPAGPLINFCVRQNIIVEAVILEFTMTGDGDNSLYIELTSPSGTRSILKLPSTGNTLFGTADPENPFDDELDGIGLNTNGFALVASPFLSWKHWGEKSGGVWTFNVLDYGPAEATPMGEDPGTGAMPDPGADMFTALGHIGIPGNPARTEKTITGFRVKIYGTDTGLPIFTGCVPLETSCPGDLDGNGIINVLDLQIYLNWFITNSPFADMNGDGIISFADLTAYRALWIPGFCTTGDNPFVGGRPYPGGTNQNGSDNNPIVRPI